MGRALLSAGRWLLLAFATFHLVAGALLLCACLGVALALSAHTQLIDQSAAWSIGYWFVGLGLAFLWLLAGAIELCAFSYVLKRNLGRVIAGLVASGHAVVGTLFLARGSGSTGAWLLAAVHGIPACLILLGLGLLIASERRSRWLHA